MKDNSMFKCYLTQNLILRENFIPSNLTVERFTDFRKMQVLDIGKLQITTSATRITKADEMETLSIFLAHFLLFPFFLSRRELWQEF